MQQCMNTVIDLTLQNGFFSDIIMMLCLIVSSVLLWDM